MNRFLASVFASLLLLGCTTPPVQTQTPEKNIPAKNLASLLEAKDHEDLSCDSVTPLIAEVPLSSMNFHCSRLNVTATIDEMKDAGWRLMGLDIGKQFTYNGVVAMPIHITMRKLF